ncbi:MAG: NADP oxidoreductase [Bdellovibrionales bacterium GWA2_49_15]|nr:MAG: NADP oxidoreductase [Bdellovibrionales bacterium GWA2_49_15]HAZ14202.1 Ni/Fe hydrogenase subunit alpha [Bdellovibrionales bacterium]
MSRKIIIDPVTRVEGHGKVTIHLNDQGMVEDSRLHIVEFRGFEKFIQGRPYWEAPVLVQRLCGICPVSHHLCSAKAIDEIVGVSHESLTPVALKMRRLMHYGQVLQSHALHFFYLAAPDLLLGIESQISRRNVVGVGLDFPELARKGILLRKFGQEIIKVTAGKKIHGISAIPGGIHKNLSLAERDLFFRGGDIPSVHEVIAWAQETLAFYIDYHKKNQSWINRFASCDSNYLSLVRSDGAMDLYHGVLRAIDSNGTRILNDVDYHTYLDLFSEEVKTWTYMKFPFLKKLGVEKGWSRVGPLARVNTCDFIPTPLAQKALEDFRGHTGARICHTTLAYHWARLIELLHCAEVIEGLLNDPDLQKDNLKVEGRHGKLGIGFLEAPRGTLIHHFEVDEKSAITLCNLIVSTTHNNEAMNRAVKSVATEYLKHGQQITEGMLNHIEVAIRAYDPCLSCATHAVGEMPLHVSLFNSHGQLIHEKYS